MSDAPTGAQAAPAAAPAEPQAAAAPPAPAAPTAPPAPAPQAPPAPAAPQQPETDKGKDPWDDPAAARAEIERLRRENAADRVNAKQAAADAAKAELTQQIGKALGLVKDDEPVDPARLTEQLTTAQKESRAQQLENAILRAAIKRGADPDALIDSRSFMERAAQTDPTDAAGIAALIDGALTGNSRFKGVQAAPAGGADLGPGGQTAPRTYTEAQLNDHDFYMANREDILRAVNEGRIRS